MKLSKLKNHIKEKNLEKKYNNSLNLNKINAPQNSFYSSEKINKFCKTNFDITYVNYYNFLSKELNLKNGDKFVDYLKEKSLIWIKKDPSIDEYDAIVYLLNMFIINPIDGKMKELKVMETIKNNLSYFIIKEPSPQEDTNECWDLSMAKDDLILYLQVKPKSFFYGMNGTSKNSLKKIKKASEKFKKPIFLTRETNGRVDVYIYNRKSCKMEFIELSSFMNRIKTQKTILDISSKTFNILENSST